VAEVQKATAGKRPFVRPVLVDYGTLERITMQSGDYGGPDHTAAGGYFGFGNKKIIVKGRG